MVRSWVQLMRAAEPDAQCQHNGIIRYARGIYADEKNGYISGTTLQSVLNMRPTTALSNIYAWVFTTLLAACCHTLPTSESSSSVRNHALNPITSNLQARALRNWYTCFDTKTTEQRRARHNDCARAATQLPNLIDPKVFHRGGDPGTDPYALPQVQFHNTCQIKVDLRFGRSDESSWLAINLAVSKIMDACSGGYGAFETTGGEIAAGNRDFVLVTVERKLASVLGQTQNTTAVATS
ncbi:MAG: hypothetical protein Q9168_005457 [Polycauliona sp. 1 TL-2023]